jgi:diadenosine tetraphosphate (Ap4A) HIT family hydrolase
MNTSSCPFCNPDRKIITENEYCFALYDKYPVSEGHSLIISKEHKKDLFDLSTLEKEACWQLIEEVKSSLTTKYNPDGWNIGMNCGKVAGQTVFHFHCHLIPRYQGDMDDPRGGVRHSVQGMGYY